MKISKYKIALVLKIFERRYAPDARIGRSPPYSERDILAFSHKLSVPLEKSDKFAQLIYGLDNSIIFWLVERLFLFQIRKRIFRYHEKNISTQQS